MKRRFIIKNLFFWQGLSLSDYQQYFASDALRDFPTWNALYSKATVIRIAVASG